MQLTVLSRAEPEADDRVPASTWGWPGARRGHRPGRRPHARGADFSQRRVHGPARDGADAVGGPIETRATAWSAGRSRWRCRSPFGVGDASLPRTPTTASGPIRWPFAAYRRDVFERVGVLRRRHDRGEDDEFNYRLRARRRAHPADAGDPLRLLRAATVRGAGAAVLGLRPGQGRSAPAPPAPPAPAPPGALGAGAGAGGRPVLGAVQTAGSPGWRRWRAAATRAATRWPRCGSASDGNKQEMPLPAPGLRGDAPAGRRGHDRGLLALAQGRAKRRRSSCGRMLPRPRPRPRRRATTEATACGPPTRGGPSWAWMPATTTGSRPTSSSTRRASEPCWRCWRAPGLLPLTRRSVLDVGLRRWRRAARPAALRGAADDLTASTCCRSASTRARELTPGRDIEVGDAQTAAVRGRVASTSCSRSRCSAPCWTRRRGARSPRR